MMLCYFCLPRVLQPPTWLTTTTSTCWTGPQATRCALLQSRAVCKMLTSQTASKPHMAATAHIAAFTGHC
jgi:hypothetical protein